MRPPMSQLNDLHFEEVRIISLHPAKTPAAENLFPATDGKSVTSPTWWRAGPGAWGCYLSHLRLLLEMQVQGWETLLILEEDVIWRPDTAERLKSLMTELPEDWGQLYLGGQHRQAPDLLSPAVYRCRSVNRTHAYAVHRRHLGTIIGHLFEIQKSDGLPKHIDHHYEDAHQRQLWPTYASSWWLAGQGANLSSIDGQQHPDRWWHHVTCDVTEIPVILTSESLEHPLLHYGPPNVADRMSDVASAARCPLQTVRVFQRVWEEAASLGRLPAVSATSRQRRILRQAFPKLMEFDESKLLELADYPRNGIFPHPWFQP